MVSNASDPRRSCHRMCAFDDEEEDPERREWCRRGDAPNEPEERVGEDAGEVIVELVEDWRGRI